MEIEKILMVEIEGLSQTIKQYSNDNYIVSYANQLTNIEYPKDKIKFSLLVERLFEWYCNEIEKIKKSEFTLSKDAHYKSLSILKELNTILRESNE